MTLGGQKVGGVDSGRECQMLRVGAEGGEVPEGALPGCPACKVGVGGDDDPIRLLAEVRLETCGLLRCESGAERCYPDELAPPSDSDREGIEGPSTSTGVAPAASSSRPSASP